MGYNFPSTPTPGQTYQGFTWDGEKWDIASIDPSGFQPIDADLTSLAAASGTNTIYYRSAANTWSPVNVSTGLAFSGGNLTATAPGGNVSNVGTPVNLQFAQWTGATTIQGITAAAAGAAIAPAWTAYTPTITAGSVRSPQ